MENKLKQLLREEKEYREKDNYNECFETCLKILDIIKTENESYKFDLLSKIFLYPNQSNFVKLSLINYLIQNSSIIKNKNSKKKYYQLLIDSFSRGKDKEYQIEINQIKKLYKKSELNDFIDLDNYIQKIVSDTLNKPNINLHNTLDSINSSMSGDSSLFNLSFKSSILNDDINIKDKLQNSFDEIITGRSEYNIESVKNNNNKNINEINLLKKYKPNNKLPMIIINVINNLNSNHFLNLINENFENCQYFNICTIKDSNNDNLRVYEYHNKNCINNLFYKLICKNNNSLNQFQVLTILKKEENNINRGINSSLNDLYERKISIKTIKGNKKNSIKAIIQFLKNLCLKIDKIQIIKQSKCFLKYNLDENLKSIINNKKSKLFSSVSNKEENENDLNKNISTNKLIDDITLVEKTNNDAKRYYEIYKIFSEKNNGLGKQISKFIENFKKEYILLDFKNNKNFINKNNNININDIDTKSAMMKIINIFEISINSLNSTFNFDNENSVGNNSSFFANAAENFILNKIYPVLYNIYDLKYKEENNIYLKKKKEINNLLSIEEICDKIGIKEKLRGKDKIPFKYVIDIISKINYEKSLKKKYEAITQASLELRNCILDYTSCKFELNSMDDELPIIIYISTQINVNNLFAELYMIEDYIKCSLRDNLKENKMVTNLLSSLFYICKEWKTGN